GHHLQRGAAVHVGRRGPPRLSGRLSLDLTLAAGHDAVNERRTLAWFAVGAVVAIAWLAHPFATGLLLGALMGFTVQPLYEGFARRTGRPLLAALTTVLA